MKKKGKEIRVTTKTGDKGESSLFSGERRRKTHIVFETLGSLDELNAHLGMAKAGLDHRGGEADRAAFRYLDEVQGYVMKAAGRTAALGDPPPACSAEDLKQATERIEAMQQALAEQLDSPEGFVRPGSSMVSAPIHVARTVCRRAERMMVRCMDEEERSELEQPQILLNRLADLLFVLALAVDERV
jgi:cob(I)alamin adenosyltransferase